MNRSDVQQADSNGGNIDDPIRAVLEASQAAETPTAAPPFFAARIRARAAEGETSVARAPVTAAAMRLLPVFSIVALLLVGTAGYESAVSASERKAAVARALARDGGGDVVLGALLLQSPGDEKAGGSK